MSEDHTHEVAAPEPQPTTNAREKVFTTYELIENILLSLPAESLPAAVRINTASYGVFKRSENVVKTWIQSQHFHSKITANYDFHDAANPTGAISLNYASWGTVISFRTQQQKEFILLTYVPKQTWSILLLMGERKAPEETKVLMARKELMDRLAPSAKESLRARLDERGDLRVERRGLRALELPRVLSDALLEIVWGKR